MKTSGKAIWNAGSWVVSPDQMPDDGFWEWVKTKNDGDTEVIPVELTFVDPRQARPKQRRLFFALLQDIWAWSGEPVEWLKAYFYSRYTIRTNGKMISLADGTENTVSDASYLIDDVIEFVFQFGVPVKQGYELLPRDEDQFQFRCVKYRRCLICGKHADIHHVDEIGSGRNRSHLDHTQFRLAALCREHHQEAHQLGLAEFLKRHHLTRMGIKVNAETLKNIGLRGDY